MKINLLSTCYPIAFLFAVILFSCKNEMKTDPDAIPDSLTVQDTISLYKFNKWVNAWISDGASFTNTSLTKSFRMPNMDLTETLAENPDSVRFHLGLDKSVSPYVPHLIIVGVDARGNDMLDYSQGQYAYDVSVVCPTDCN